MRWKRSKTRTSSSAVVDLGGVDDGPQHGVDLLPPRMPHEGPHGAQLADPHDGEEVGHRVGVEDRLDLDHLGAERFEHLDRPPADGEHFGVDVGVAQRRGPDHADRDVGIFYRRQPRCFRAWQGAQVGRVGADGHIEGGHDVGDTAGHGTVGGEVEPAGRVGAAAGHPPQRGLHAREAAARPTGSGSTRPRRNRWPAAPCRRPGRPPPRPTTHRRRGRG